MAQLYYNEREFIKQNSIFIQNKDLYGLYNASLDPQYSDIEFWRVMYILFKINRDPLSFVDKVSPYLLDGFDMQDFNLTIPANVQSCELENICCSTISFLNPNTTINMKNMECQSIELPENFDASGREKHNFIGENVRSNVIFPHSTSEIGNIFNKTQSGLIIYIPPKNITFSKDLIEAGLRGYTDV